jgi:hypothetical protein
LAVTQATEGSHIPYYLSWGSERITMETRILNFKEQTGEWMLRNSVGGKERDRESESEESNQRPFSSIFIKALGPCDVYILLLRMEVPLSPSLFSIPRKWKEEFIDFTSSSISLLPSSGKMGGASLIIQNIFNGGNISVMLTS